MDANNLSQRLMRVAHYVPQGARLADIGSDHAYLPVYLAKKGQISYAVAGEVVAGPYQNATKVIANSHMDQIVIPRLADGLQAFSKADKIDTVTICGMGGPLIVSILNAGKQQLADRPRLILQPNVGEDSVRRWLNSHAYEITAEEILEESGHIYEIIVAFPVDAVPKLAAEEMLFGPFLMRSKEQAFIKKWTRELHREEKVLHSLTKAKTDSSARSKMVQARIDLIKEMLADDNS
ncbi:SAM-dependent methyltransferase [Ligilactobacillus salitolerans]|uniref:SAM-dependent methyltransferase n=1 Tax=Ligilactobacillus salitolerans TaxID=1808352 RepID=A0A401IU30_9LACO|nr:tRNA (adenine(22)-N(1))-methyltransferase TrmK [Ligilactobacillus salitolerans]GBG95024.1 SAM-dependent methyltransferase [Ligilactobacillus salitolerans]